MAKDPEKKKKRSRPPADDRAILEIDRTQLEVEWEQQPLLYWDAARELAEAKRSKDQLEIDLSVAKADADNEVRKDPEAFGLEKVTEPAIKAAILGHKKVQQLQADLIDAAYMVNLLEGKCRALEHRKRALEKEVDLFLAGYFAAPRDKRKTMAPSGERKKARGLRDDDEDED